MRNATSQPDVMEQMERVLRQFVSAINARSVLRLALRRSGLTEQDARAGHITPPLVDALCSSVKLYVSDRGRMLELTSQLRAIAGVDEEASKPVEIVVNVEAESDVVRVRGEARQLAQQMGFNHTDQIKITTAVSELARNIFCYAGEGRIVLSPQPGPPERLEIVAEDEGPGIDNLEDVLSGRYRSKTGLGRGLIGCRQLADSFDVDTAPGRGTRVRLVKERGR